LPARRIKLRYAATCAVCLTHLDSGATASWDAFTKMTTCLACADDPARAAQSGSAGHSAAEQARRLRAKQQQRKADSIDAHPILARLVNAIDPPPDAGRSWATGAVGEQTLGRCLDALTTSGVQVLHDRRLPGSKANIDHIAVTANGVWIIDAKRYRGRVEQVNKGGWLREDHRLYVAGRDRSILLAGVHKQVVHVELALFPTFGPSLPVRGALCFVDGKRTLFSKPFVLDRVLVTWEQKLPDRLLEPGPITTEMRGMIHRRLAESLPPT
jgi:hypothetical protein